MSLKHIAQSDLNLLLMFQVLIEERSITRAAKRAFRSQPAMSRILDRLQEMFGDELLIRTKRGYEPTRRALHLYKEVNSILSCLEGLLEIDTFDPFKTSETFKIAATDYASIVLLPGLVARVAKYAPLVHLEIVPWEEEIFQRLEAGALDFVLWGNIAPPELKIQSLFREKLMCLVRKQHPLTKKAITLKQFASFPHAAVTLTVNTQAFIDQILKQHGLERDLRLVIPYFAAAGWIVEQSDMVITMPQRLARILSKATNTAQVNPPAEIARSRDYLLVWHPRMDSEPAHRWFRQLIKEVASGN